MSRSTIRMISFVVASITALVAVATLLYFVPCPTRIDQQMTGAELSADGQVIQECTLRVKGWKLNYLFKQDRIKMDEFHVENLPNLNLPAEYGTILYEGVSEEYLYTAWMWMDSYNSKAVMIFIAIDNSWILCKTDDRYFAVSVEGGFSPEEIWETVTAGTKLR